MKRTLWALLSALALGLCGLIPSQAQAVVTCTSAPVAGNAWPHDQLWTCATPGTTPLTWSADITAATQALQKLGSGSISVLSDAKVKLTKPVGGASTHNFYLFPNNADYQTFCKYTAAQAAPAPNMTQCFTLAAGNPGGTYLETDNVTRTTFVLDSVIYDPLYAAYASVGSVFAHEAGHHLEIIYAPLVGGGVTRVSDYSREFGDKVAGSTLFLTNAGSIQNGDKIVVTFNGPAIGTIPITYTVTTSGPNADANVNDIAIHLAAAINANPTLLAQKIGTNNFAIPSGATVQIKTGAIIHYDKVITSGGAGAAHLGSTISSYDWPAFQELPQCGGQLPFEQKKDVAGDQICSSLQNAQVGGSVHAGDHLKITVTDPVLAPNPYTFTYVVQAADTSLNLLVKNLVIAYNNDPTLPNTLTAQQSGTTVRLSSATLKSTSYAVSVTEVGHETFTLSGAVQVGMGDTTNKIDGTNVEILQNAWSHIFTLDAATTSYKELFAEETAIVAGQIVGGSQTSDNFLQSGNFQCTLNFVRAVEMWGVRPGKIPATNPNGTPYTGGAVFNYNTPCAPNELLP